ncbi:MAG: ABC transporter substrate-binding protein [Desulfitobacterium hafniense]|nr:ABC transporter substrate-binding protein [Desulfitobacterium hafniense]
MKKQWIVAIVAVYIIFIFSLVVYSGEKTHVFKIGILSVNADRLEKIQGLRDGLERLRYQEGQNVIYTSRNAKDDLDKLPLLADELLKGKPDVLVAAGAAEAGALKNATSELKSPPPVIFMGTLSPVKLGLVDSATQPSGNLTGLDNYHLELTPKRIEILHRLLPEIRSVAVLGDKRILAYEQIQETVQLIAKEFPLTIKMYTVGSVEEVEPVFREMQREKVEAIVLLPGFFLETNTEQIISQATQRSLPVFGLYPSDAEKGCLASYGTSYFDQGAQTAQMVDKVLKGAKPGEIPVETPDKLVFVINLKTARELGITLSPTVLSFADKVIQP